MQVLAKFHGNLSILHTLYIRLKRKDSLEKQMRVFTLQRSVNMAHLIREMCQHKKPLANEITEPPAFTVSKQELRGKAIVLVTFFARTLLGGSHQQGKQKQSNLRGKKRKSRSKCDCKEALVNDMKSWLVLGSGSLITFLSSGKFVPIIFCSTDSRQTFGCSTTLFISRFLFADL